MTNLTESYKSSIMILYSTNVVGQYNPIRYRGYYYDTDTGFYYLQSRYYELLQYNFYFIFDILYRYGDGVFVLIKGDLAVSLNQGKRFFRLHQFNSV